MNDAIGIVPVTIYRDTRGAQLTGVPGMRS